jgi:LemA protein
MKKGVVVLIIVVGFFVFFGLSLAGMYNQLIKADEEVTGRWSQVENVYQRRSDLVPNLVETVKGYALHESQTLEKVTEARASIGQFQITKDVVNDPAQLEQFQKMQGQLSSALSRLLAVAEQYPDLKANENFLTLQTQLEGTENRIAVERMRFNESALRFNTLRRQFPSNLVAQFAQLKEKAYFKADEGSAKAPKVTF